jgi:hypothetical protein
MCEPSTVYFFQFHVSLSVTFVISPCHSSHSTAQIVVMFFNFITGLCLPIVSFVLITIPSTSAISPSLRSMFRIFPAFNLGDGILQLALCTDGKTCPTISSDGYDFDETQGPWSWDMTGADITLMLAQAIVYFALAMLIGRI